MPSLWTWTERIAALLEPAERQSVLGDIQERGPNLRALLDLIGLVARRQLQPWTSWEPWVIAASLALPARFAWSMTNPIAFMAHSGYVNSFASEWGTFLILPWRLLGVPGISWAIGFVLAYLGKRRSASILTLLLALSAGGSYNVALRAFTTPLWPSRFQLSYTAKEHIALAVQLQNRDLRFVVAVIAMTLLTALPCIWGFRRGLRNQPLHLLTTIALLTLCSPVATGLIPPSNRPILYPLMLASIWPIIYMLKISRKVSHAH
ncbi:MAG: hypothetical protein ABIR70_14055 [Bryobacteraceae bacterium]